MMKKLLIVAAIATLGGCHWAREKANNAANKTGEVVAEAGAEFADGVAKGVNKSMQQSVSLSDTLRVKGLQMGQITLGSVNDGTDNLLSVYFIYNADVNTSVTARVLDEQGLEYGRTKASISGKKGEAGFVDFVFDKRTNIATKSKVILQP